MPQLSNIQALSLFTASLPVLGTATKLQVMLPTGKSADQRGPAEAFPISAALPGTDASPARRLRSGGPPGPAPDPIKLKSKANFGARDRIWSTTADSWNTPQTKPAGTRLRSFKATRRGSAR